ncbi:hypothetical protein [Tenacibaculum phage Larrie]|nr:hypothetical protein [Tenacibaculum phage Larrie]
MEGNKYFNNFDTTIQISPSLGDAVLLAKINKDDGYELKKYTGYGSKHHTTDVLVIWNKSTQRLSTKRVNKSSKGEFITLGGGYGSKVKRLYLKDFKTMSERIHKAREEMLNNL